MGISLWQLLIILLIILLVFGTKKLRTIGTDLGGAVKGFRESIGGDDKDDKSADSSEQLEHNESERVIDGEVSKQDKEKV